MACVSLGGLLFGRNKENVLPATGIQVVAYQGLDKSAPVIGNRYFGKPLIQDLPLLMDYLDVHNPASFDRPIAARQEKRRFPPSALREAVVNAICHHDYTIKGSPILIEFFADRLVITSLGRGIATLFAAMREQGHPDPELTAGDSYFRVTLPVRSTD